MVCNRCRTLVPNGTNICPTCGNNLVAQARGQQVNNNRPPQGRPVNQSNNAPQEIPTASQVLTFGILAAALGNIFGVPGIVLGIIGRKKAKIFAAHYGFLSGQAKTGNILALIGFIVGIVVTALLSIWMLSYMGTLLLFI